jgi:hypothetical protein
VVDGLVEGLLRDLARLLRRRQDLVVEHREIEGQPQTNGVRGRQVCIFKIYIN